MFHDLNENRKHYDQVTDEQQPLYFQRFDTGILDSNPLVAAGLDRAFQQLFPNAVGKVLDVGCGTAFYYPLLSRHANCVLGVDVSRSMLDHAEALIARNELANCSVQECSALDLCVESESVDVVHCWDFLHHVSDVSQALKEFRRVLKPGGRLIAVEPNLMNPSITWYHARRRSEWRLFTQNQFSIVPKLRRNFDLSVHYDNTIISFLNERTEWLWNCVNAFTSVRPFHLMSFRYVIDATKTE